MSNAAFARHVARAVEQFRCCETLFMHYNDDKTGYIMILSNPDSCYGVIPFFVYFRLPTEKFVLVF